MTADPENGAGLQQEGPGVLGWAGLGISAGQIFRPEQADVWFPGMRRQGWGPVGSLWHVAVKDNSVKGWALELC